MGSIPVGDSDFVARLRHVEYAISLSFSVFVFFFFFFLGVPFTRLYGKRP